MPCRDSPHHEIEIVMSFIFMNLFKPNEHKEVCRKGNENFFEIEDKIYNYVGDKVVAFKTSDEIVKSSWEFGFNDIKYAFAYSEENIF